jgi:hypothetical protein
MPWQPGSPAHAPTHLSTPIPTVPALAEEPDGIDVASYLSRTKEVLDEDEHNVTSGRGAFDVMLTTYSMFERESQRHT